MVPEISTILVALASKEKCTLDGGEKPKEKKQGQQNKKHAEEKNIHLHFGRRKTQHKQPETLSLTLSRHIRLDVAQRQTTRSG